MVVDRLIHGLFHRGEQKTVAPVMVPLESESKQQRDLKRTAYEDLQRLKPILKAKGVNLGEIERVAYKPPEGRNLLVKGDKDVRDFAVACLRIFGDRTEDGRNKPTVEINLNDSDFTYTRALGVIADQTIGAHPEIQSFEDFEMIAGGKAFNIAVDIGPLTNPENAEIKRFADIIRVKAQGNSEIKVLVFLSSDAPPLNIPSEIGRLI